MIEDREPQLTELLEVLGSDIVEVNRQNGWDVLDLSSWNSEQIYLIPTKLALVISEISEALEAYRNSDLELFKEEMADAFIRILDITHGLEIDIGGTILAKLDKNRTRGFRHGGKRV